jgi:selenocysteine-specific elongation factor
VVEALRAGPLTLEQLAASTGVPVTTLGPSLPEMKLPHGVFEWKSQYYTGEWVDHRGGQVQQAIRAYLDEHRLRPSAPREHIRSAVHLDQATFGFLIEIMEDINGVIVDGSGLSLHNYEVRLTDAQQAVVDEFMARLRATPYSPPTDGLPPPALLQWMHGHALVNITPAGIVFTVEAFSEMKERTRAHIQANGSITMAEFRDLFGTSRKYAQAFLEHLDALHITRRNGDVRTLR